jgi:hypothetical protein
MLFWPWCRSRHVAGNSNKSAGTCDRPRGNLFNTHGKEPGSRSAAAAELFQSLESRSHMMRSP